MRKMAFFSRIILLGLFLFSFQPILSQNHPSNGDDKERMEQQLLNLKEHLGLDDLQFISVKNILLKYREQKLDLIKTSERSDILTAKLQEIDMQQDNELLKFISEEQLEKMKVWLKEQPSNRNKKDKKNKKGKKRNNNQTP